MAECLLYSLAFFGHMGIYPIPGWGAGALGLEVLVSVWACGVISARVLSCLYLDAGFRLAYM